MIVFHYLFFNFKINDLCFQKKYKLIFLKATFKKRIGNEQKRNPQAKNR